MSAAKFEFKSILTRRLLDPVRHKGSPFTFVHCRDTKEVFFTDAEGNYINFGSILAAVVNGSLPLALPASPVAGPQGPRGDTGAQGPPGRDGADSTVPGPKGDKGDLLVPTDAEMRAAVTALRLQLARVRAAMFLEMERILHPSCHPNVRAHIKGALQRIKKEIDALGVPE
jgi:hypothetical protein